MFELRMEKRRDSKLCEEMRRGIYRLSASVMVKT